LVDTHDNCLGVILGGGRVDDLLGSSIDDRLGLLLGEEDTSRLANIVGSEGTPTNFLGVAASRSLNLLSIEDKEVSIDLNSLLGLSVDSVVLVLVCHVIRSGRSSIDSLQVTRTVFHDNTGHKTTNTSESVDTHAGGHGHGGIVVGGLQGGSREAGKGFVRVFCVIELRTGSVFTYDPEKAAAEPADARTTAAENFMMTFKDLSRQIVSRKAMFPSRSCLDFEDPKALRTSGKYESTVAKKRGWHQIAQRKPAQ
jgi:hypothetical protein